MKYPIKEHKGQQIYYDDNNDKFVCDIELGDNLKNAKRGKLSDIEREIDLFIKANFNFVPFTVFLKNYRNKKIRIVSIRTDGVLIDEDKNQYRERDFNYFYNADYDTMKEMEINESTYLSALKCYDDRKKELLSRLTKMDMSQYIKSLNP